MNERTNLINERLRLGMNQDEMAKFLGFSYRTYNDWENGHSTPHPGNADQIAKKLGKSKEELDLLPRKEQPVTVEGSPQEILEQIDSGISWCNRLINNGGRSEIEAACAIAGTYLPVLSPMMPTKYGPGAAALISRIHHLRRRSAHHYAGPEAVLACTEKAAEYARMSQDPISLIMALVHHASAYDYDHPSLCVPQRLKRGMSIIEEPIALLERHRDMVPHQVAAWVHSQHAKWLAMTGRRSEAKSATGRAQDYFSKHAADMDGRYFTGVNITRQGAMTYMELGEQEKALPIFLSHIDVDAPEVTAKVPMGLQVRLSTINTTITSLLRAPVALKDREMTIRLWEAQHQIARDLDSMLYLNESRKQYEIMACVFAGDPAIVQLEERLHEGGM